MAIRKTSTERTKRFRAKAAAKVASEARLKIVKAIEGNWLNWALRVFFQERELPSITFIPLSDFRNGLISSADFRLSDFFDSDDKLLSALGKEIETAVFLDTNAAGKTFLRPKFLMET